PHSGPRLRKIVGVRAGSGRRRARRLALLHRADRYRPRDDSQERNLLLGNYPDLEHTGYRTRRFRSDDDGAWLRGRSAGVRWRTRDRRRPVLPDEDAEERAILGGVRSDATIGRN